MRPPDLIRGWAVGARWRRTGAAVTGDHRLPRRAIPSSAAWSARRSARLTEIPGGDSNFFKDLRGILTYRRSVPCRRLTTWPRPISRRVTPAC